MAAVDVATVNVVEEEARITSSSASFAHVERERGDFV
jgi:hypothetical protein